MPSAPPITWPSGRSAAVAGNSPARHTLVGRGRVARNQRLSRRAFARLQAELLLARLHRVDYALQVLVEVHAELVGCAAHLLAVDRCSEARLLELLLHRLGRQPDDAGRPDQGTGGDEAGQLVDGEEGLREGCCAWLVQELG